MHSGWWGLSRETMGLLYLQHNHFSYEIFFFGLSPFQCHTALRKAQMRYRLLNRHHVVSCGFYDSYVYVIMCLVSHFLKKKKKKRFNKYQILIFSILIFCWHIQSKHCFKFVLSFNCKKYLFLHVRKLTFLFFLSNISVIATCSVSNSVLSPIIKLCLILKLFQPINQ